jgi:hypothetical protein
VEPVGEIEGQGRDDHDRQDDQNLNGHEIIVLVVTSICRTRLVKAANRSPTVHFG